MGGVGGSGYIISTSTCYLASSPEFPPAKIPVMQTTLVCVLCKSNKICIAMGRKILLTIPAIVKVGLVRDNHVNIILSLGYDDAFFAETRAVAVPFTSLAFH